jgi:cell wall-associated NlpC family hydrolase
MIPAAEVVNEARSLLGTPYRHQGRSKTAVDCIGLIVVVARELELFDPNRLIPANYSARPKDGLLEKNVAEVCMRVDVVEPGLIALFRWSPRAPAAHCAILTDDGMIHSYKTVGCVVEHGYRAKWPTRLHSLWRMHRVDY